MNCKLTLSALLLGFLLPVAVIAQDEDSDKTTQAQETTKQTESQKQQTADSSQSDDAAEQNENSDEFIPSEEISEDLSVAFPVDI